MVEQAVITSSAAQLDRKHAVDAARRSEPRDALIVATAAGLRQVVFVAPDLDPRPYVLPWPDGTTVFVLDPPTVLEFTSTTLAADGVVPTATVRAVPVDTRRRWSVRRLMLAGFDPSAPTLWIVEGLLPFLGRDDTIELLTDITALSRSHSRLVSQLPSYPFRDSGTLDLLDSHGWHADQLRSAR